MDLADVTVLVPTKDEAANVDRFLASIPREVALVAVDASADDTPERLRARGGPTEVVLHPGNVTVARQVGAERARTRWLLFTDADVTFAPGYFERLAALELDARVGGVVGAKATLDGHALYHAAFLAGQRALAAVGVPAASGSNMLVRRDALEACGGFDLRLTCNEDSEVMWRVRRAGHRVVFRPDLVVHARDHRRLRRGAGRKMLHSVARCSLLYLGLMPERWRGADWGYWGPGAQEREPPER